MDKVLWEKAVVFHGHQCPGLAIGVKAAMIAMQRFQMDGSKDEDIVCVVENDSCSVDGIQVLLGCTMGKGNLLYRPRGKQAFSFFNRTTGESFRLCMRHDGRAQTMSRDDYMHYILEASDDDIFAVSKPRFELPERARMFKSIICEKCGEGAAEPTMHLQDGMVVCSDCFDHYDRGW